MKIDVLTLFPDMFKGPFDESIMKIAKKKGLIEINLCDIRQWTFDKHRSADDKPFGGGPGMVMKVEPVDMGIKEIKNKANLAQCVEPKIILLTPQGEKFNQSVAVKISRLKHIVLICGHYEGVDERIRSFVDFEISIGDYVLTCGEIPAMVICDSIVRLLPGVLGDEESIKEESFENGLLEYPQYTRPSEYKGMKIPEILLCGDPKKIKKWRSEESLRRTKERRPDLL
ncbi:tRNA (guanine-N1)-methyltransferase [Candidatus Omnitrophus magneticus]|uniref:tRNA (guanine-N(1)-)-methyltransferase n=1 Tax=Candidatus Omnitrophus magneticus TaxID=1609969 RepID=A0A0F0CP84_9BACT|nr:tRNA (guanine-N1)-methyltransferase [Candidatus Omnitrophus magneticus]